MQLECRRNGGPGCWLVGCSPGCGCLRLCPVVRGLGLREAEASGGSEAGSCSGLLTAALSLARHAHSCSSGPRTCSVYFQSCPACRITACSVISELPSSRAAHGAQAVLLATQLAGCPRCSGCCPLSSVCPACSPTISLFIYDFYFRHGRPPSHIHSRLTQSNLKSYGLPPVPPYPCQFNAANMQHQRVIYGPTNEQREGSGPLPLGPLPATSITTPNHQQKPHRIRSSSHIATRCSYLHHGISIGILTRKHSTPAIQRLDYHFLQGARACIRPTRLPQRQSQAQPAWIVCSCDGGYAECYGVAYYLDLLA